MGLIDFHCHVLPGVDDGVKTLDSAKEQFLAYQEAGFDRLVFTPHVYNPYVRSRTELFREQAAVGMEAASQYGLTTWLGCELFVGSQPKLKAIPIMGKYVLCEFDRFLQPQMLVERLRQLTDRNFTVVLAHVERYRWLSVECEMFHRLQSLDVLVQVNVEAVESGEAVPWLEMQLADIIATDNHGDATLPGRVREQLGKWPYLLKRMERLHP